MKVAICSHRRCLLNNIQSESRRPRPIVAFEMMSMVVVFAALTRFLMNLYYVGNEFPLIVMGMQALVIITYIILTLLVSRRRSKLAIIVLVSLFIFGIPRIIDIVRYEPMEQSLVLILGLALVQVISFLIL